jgi:predicted ATPase/DNA-binding winged helix-turn-helix (wHTH) protein
MSMTPGPSGNRAIWFGPFRLLPAQRLLLQADKPVQLGSRAIEILIALVECEGELVSKGELIARVWPDTVVDESNLKVHIAALRKALGDGNSGNRYVINVPGRGYRFVASISRVKPDEAERPSDASIRHTRNLRAPVSQIYGRAENVAALSHQLSKHRFVTIVGPGGIGKTTVALATVQEMAESFGDEIQFVDLAPLSDPSLVSSALAAPLGIAVYSNPMPALLDYLRDKRMLIVLDSCEHLIEEAAALAEKLLESCAGLIILATSREPMQGAGERVYRLPPLELPPVCDALAAANAVTYPAIRLFVERVAACIDGFQLSDADAPLVADICRRLDGNALAIEMAAGRVPTFGVGGVNSRLDDRFRLLKSSRRKALPRHRALSATIDWSYDLLSEFERTILRRLAVFTGVFTMAAASAVAAGAGVTPSEVPDGMALLINKSLLTADLGNAIATYRLLDSTRAYALEKLIASDEYDQQARRHAEHHLEICERARADSTEQNTPDWVATYGGHLDDARAALDWAFSAAGDAALGVQLTISAVPLWLNISLMDECRKGVIRALEAGQIFDRQRMVLLTALGVSLYSIGPKPETKAAWTGVLEIAEALRDDDFRLRALWGLWVVGVTGGKQRPALALARKFANLAAKSGDRVASLMGERLIGTSLHFLGEHDKGRQYIERTLGRFVAAENRSHAVRFQFDQTVSASAYAARISWIMGFPDQALRTAETGVAQARALGHSLSLCYVLGSAACPLTLAVGDLSVAERNVATLIDHSDRHGLLLWQIMGRRFKGNLAFKTGDHGAGLQLLFNAIDALHEAGFRLYHTETLAEYAEALAIVGHIAQGLFIINRALAQSRRNEERWCLPELLRIKGDLTRRTAVDGSVAAAEKLLLESLDWARRQQALSWELRTSLSLARLRRDQGRVGQAREELAATYARFTEGFATADLDAARTLIAELGEMRSQAAD